MPGSPLTLVVVDPYARPGQLTRAAWATLDAARAPSATRTVSSHAAAVREAGVDLADVGERLDEQIDVLLCASIDDAATVGAPADSPVVAGADAPLGAHLLDLVSVMDRLRSPGGCPWDAEQTHSSLAPYAVEEAYELADAIADGDRDEMADELGDVLLQVVFHARVAQDHPDAPFDVDDVADRIVAKLRRRHPHVFADVTVESTADVEANWEVIKKAEKPERLGPLAGIPSGLPPLERAAKVATRLSRAGHAADLLQIVERCPSPVGREMLQLVVHAVAAGTDPAMALRDALADVEGGFDDAR